MDMSKIIDEEESIKAPIMISIINLCVENKVEICVKKLLTSMINVKQNKQ